MGLEGIRIDRQRSAGIPQGLAGIRSDPQGSEVIRRDLKVFIVWIGSKTKIGHFALGQKSYLRI